MNSVVFFTRCDSSVGCKFTKAQLNSVVFFRRCDYSVGCKFTEGSSELGCIFYAGSSWRCLFQRLLSNMRFRRKIITDLQTHWWS
jgi:hypothetical protein